MGISYNEYDTLGVSKSGMNGPMRITCSAIPVIVADSYSEKDRRLVGKRHCCISEHKLHLCLWNLTRRFADPLLRLLHIIKGYNITGPGQWGAMSMVP